MKENFISRNRPRTQIGDVREKWFSALWSFRLKCNVFYLKISNHFWQKWSHVEARTNNIQPKKKWKYVISGHVTVQIQTCSWVHKRASCVNFVVGLIWFFFLDFSFFPLECSYWLEFPCRVLWTPGVFFEWVVSSRQGTERRSNSHRWHPEFCCGRSELKPAVFLLEALHCCRNHRVKLTFALIQKDKLGLFPVTSLLS